MNSRFGQSRFLASAMACGILWGMAFAGGCASDRAGAALRAYPDELVQKTVLDIQVFRRETVIEFTNTTSDAIGPGTIWLNKRFSRAIEKIAIGERVELPLTDFQDEFGDVFRAGGFFAAEPPQRLVLAQLEVAGEDGTPRVLGMIVVNTSSDQ